MSSMDRPNVRQSDHTDYMDPEGWSLVLSSRYLLMTFALALIALPAIQASETLDGVFGVIDPQEAPMSEPPLGRPHEPERPDTDMVLQTIDRVEDEADAQASAAIAALEAQLQAILYTTEDAVHQAQQLPQEAEERLPLQDEPAEEGPVAPAAEPEYVRPTGNIVSLAYEQPALLVGATAAAAGVLFWLAGTTGAAGQASTASTAELRRLLPYASPLFTRFEKDTVLGHPKREALYAQIMKRPGTTLQDLCDLTGLSRTAVSHHLRILEQQHLIVSKRMGRSRHFFENGGRYGRDQKDAYAVLHNDRSKEVHGFIRKNPGAIQKDLCEALGIQASVVHWHVKRLAEASLIDTVRQGRTVSYFPTQAI